MAIMQSRRFMLHGQSFLRCGQCTLVEQLEPGTQPARYLSDIGKVSEVCTACHGQNRKLAAENPHAGYSTGLQDTRQNAK